MKKVINKVSLLFIISIFVGFVIIIVGINNNWFFAETEQKQADRLDVYILNVGDAFASILRFSDKTVIIDIGTSYEQKHIENILEEIGIEKVDLLILTHPHSDHYGGFMAMKSYDVELVYISPQNSDKPFYNEALEFFRNKSTVVQVPPIGAVLDIEGVKFRFLGPIDYNDDINDMSIVVKVSLGKTDILFSSDMTGIECNQIIDAGYDLSADIYIVAHHGSNADGANSYRLLREVMPEYAIISSAGAQSYYQYPHEAVLSRLENLDCLIFRTDLYGDIHFYTDGETISF